MATKLPTIKSTTTKKRKSKFPLSSPTLHVRMRPLDAEGPHSSNGEPVFKQFHGYSKDGITLKDDHGLTTYSFPQDTLGTDTTQQQAYQSVAENQVKNFIEFEGYSSLIFAYGQTGTGKTYTIFGPEPSWNALDHEFSGIFPRAVHDVLTTMNATNEKFILTCSAVEFYMMDVFDLLDPNHNRALIEDDGTIYGVNATRLNNEEDTVKFMEVVRAHRTSKSTRMNSCYGGHGGSSRSHAALILTLKRKVEDEYCSNILHIVDLAGAERPTSNGYQRLSAFDALMAYYNGDYSNLEGCQGTVVNYDLSCLRTAIVQATDAYKKNGKFNPPKQMATSFVMYASGCLSGKNHLSVIVTMSAAPSCGWETWFSCQYGEDLSVLKVPVKKNKKTKISNTLTTAKKAVAETTKALASTSNVSGHPTQKYFHRRTCQKKDAIFDLQLLEELVEM